MASDDSSGPRPSGPIVLRIKLRYDDVEVMVQRFAANVGKSGLFLPTRSVQPIGAEIKFELRLADDTPVLVGLGRVKSARPPDPQHPRVAFGMAVELMRVTPQSRALILRMLERRREAGLPEIALPTASDIDAARRAEAVEAGGRELASGPVPMVTPAASSPVAPTAPTAPTTPTVPTVPTAPGAPGSPTALPGEGLLTAPRRTTGPMAIAKVAAIAPLGPEPPRKRRMAISEIIETASGPIASVSAAVPGLDDDVDVAATIARARALAGGALDAELEALCEVAAAPVEVSIEAASAELARQLGGNAVRRDRSAGWAPPPATAAASRAQATAEDAAAAGSQRELDLGAAQFGERRLAEPEPGRERDLGAAQFGERSLAESHIGERPLAEPQLAEPQLAEPQLGVRSLADPASDSDPVPEMPAIELAGVVVAPVVASDAQAEREPSPVPIRTEPSQHLALSSRGVGALAELDGDEQTEMGDMPVPGDGFEAPAEAGSPAEPGVPATLDPEAAEPPLHLGVDELDDFEILAEADADDEDLLASHGEHDASHRRAPRGRPVTAERRPSELDFAARLDLDDDSDRYLAIPSDEFSAHHVIDSLHDELTGEHTGAGQPTGFADDHRPLDPHAASAGAALAAFEIDDDEDDPVGRRRGVQPIFEPEASNSFTLAGTPSDAIDLDAPSAFRGDLGDAGGRDIRPSGPRRPEPAILRSPPLSLHEAPVEDYELEHALEALDVDLDDLSIPHAATELQRDRSGPTAAIRPAAVARTPAPESRAPASQSRAPAPESRAPALQSRAPAPESRVPAPQSRAPAPQSRVPAPDGRAAVPQSRVPAPDGRAPISQSRVSAPDGRAPAPQSRAPAPEPRVPAPTPSRAVRQTGQGTPSSGRVVVPRVPSEGVDIEFDDDD